VLAGEGGGVSLSRRSKQKQTEGKARCVETTDYKMQSVQEGHEQQEEKASKYIFHVRREKQIRRLGGGGQKQTTKHR
jgi:hypothetical protein